MRLNIIILLFLTVMKLNSQTISEKERLIIDNLNSYRVKIGLNVLQFDEKASNLCKEHVNYMLSTKKISHDNFKERVVRLGVGAVAENVCYSVEDPVKLWIGSPPHKENMEGDYNYVGVACKDGYSIIILYKK